MGLYLPLFTLFSSFHYIWKWIIYSITGFEPQISGSRSDRSYNCTTTSIFCINVFSDTSIAISLCIHQPPVWPDWVIYWTLCNFLKPLATINLPDLPTFLGNFCKGVKIYHFCSEIIFGQLLKIFGDFFWSHCDKPHNLSTPLAVAKIKHSNLFSFGKILAAIYKGKLGRQGRVPFD